jgi:hypothetical protein
MKRAIIHTLIYYGTCIIVFLLLSYTTKQPAHVPGLNYWFFFLIFIIGCCLTIANLIKCIVTKNARYNWGAFIIHSIVVIGTITWYLIGYYSQFE